MSVAATPGSSRSTTAATTSRRRRTAGPRPRRFQLNPAYLFIAPSLILIAVFIVEPIVASGWMSLHDWTIGEATHRFVGLGNYRGLLGDARFRNALGVTLEYTAVVAAGQVVLGLALAERLRRTTWFSSVLRAAFFFPFIASLAVTGVVWRFLLDPQVGLVDAWLARVGLGAPDWLQSTSLALPVVMVIGIWKNFGFSMIVLLAGMQAVPTERYESARLDGANGAQQFRHVTLPALRGPLLFVTIIATVTGLQLFDLVYVMTSGGPVFHTESIVEYLYQKAFVDFRLGYASAIAWILFVLIMVVSVVQLRIARYRDVD